MRPLTVVVTAAGAPGARALLRALKENGEREVRLVACDMNELSIGQFVADAFELVPRGDDPGFADAVLDLALRHGADLVLPESSNEVEALALAKTRFDAEGIALLVSPVEGIRTANDKGAFYELLDRLGVRGPEWRRTRGGLELAAAAEELGYPERAVCMKPAVEKGGRGFRVLDPTVDRAHQLLHGRPGNVAMRLEEVVELLPERDGEEVLVMELLTGKEEAIDGIARGGRILLGHPKTREAIRAGLAMYWETFLNEDRMAAARAIVGALELDHFWSVNLVGDAVIELNPRISTIVYQEDLNLPWLGVKHALGEISDDELGSHASRVRPTRRALRFFDQVEWDEGPG
jgi:carbamoyl-phosphate synthase large subunit